MTFTFLGTSAGTPTKDRNVSGLSLEMDNSKNWSLFDCGEGTQHQILKTSLSIVKLEKIFITHFHGDHCYGLFGLLASKSMNRSNIDLEIYAPKGIKKFLQNVIEVTNLQLSFNLKIIEVKAEDEFKFKDFNLKVLKLKHNLESVAYHIIENRVKVEFDIKKALTLKIEPKSIYKKLKNEEVVKLEDGRVFNGVDFITKKSKKREVIIAGDNSKPSILNPNLKDIDLLIHEATYTKETFDNLKLKVEHSTAKELAITSEEANVKNLILTHISPRYNFNFLNSKNSIFALAKEVSENFNGNFFIASDFDKYYLNEDGELFFTNSI